mmetsp:Transcript_9370/g.16895  ORF Transcript_9370/g.16895 Transcript_9370/m.16895 type:complete len:320 (-) Transcript_9370:830-1789(-)
MSELANEMGESAAQADAILDSRRADAAAQQTAGLFDPSAMKKKKKKKVKEEDAEEAAVLTEELKKISMQSGTETRKFNDGNDVVGEAGMDDLDPNSSKPTVEIPTVDFTGKKRPRKKLDFGDEDELFSWILREVAGVDTAVTSTESKKQRVPAPWEGSDRDYTYSELLHRAFELMHGKNAGSSGEGDGRKRFRLRAPQVAREGSKKTVFLNFGEICKSIHRQPDHLLAYLGAELGTTGNLQEGGRLVIKGKFQPKGIENVLRRYIKEYVSCSSCLSWDTVLMRDANTRLYFLQCESCGATRSVAPIRQGFMAQVTRRKK